MNQLLKESVAARVARPDLRCESQLRVAANMLSRARPSEISATTVVGVLGRDEETAFRELVARIVDALNLDARVRLHVGSFSVRFTRRTDARRDQVDGRRQPSWRH